MIQGNKNPVVPRSLHHRLSSLRTSGPAPLPTRFPVNFQPRSTTGWFLMNLRACSTTDTPFLDYSFSKTALQFIRSQPFRLLPCEPEALQTVAGGEAQRNHRTSTKPTQRTLKGCRKPLPPIDLPPPPCPAPPFQTLKNPA